MRARRTCAALAAALLVGLWGCGDAAEKNAYVRALNRAQSGLAQRFEGLQTHITATSTPQQDQRTLAGYESAVREAVARLRAVEPPEGLDDLHRRFIDDIADYGTEVRRARQKLESGRPDDALAAQRRLTTAVARIGTRINATIKAINAALQG